MFKQVYDKSDGSPVLIETDTFDTETYTDIQPTDGLYQPIFFDGKEWVGTSYEEWLNSQPDLEPAEPEPLQKIAANLQIQLMKSNISLSQLQKQNGKMMLEIIKLKGGK